MQTDITDDGGWSVLGVYQTEWAGVVVMGKALSVSRLLLGHHQEPRRRQPRALLPVAPRSPTTVCQVKFCYAWQHAQLGQVVVQHLERVLLCVSFEADGPVGSSCSYSSRVFFLGQ